MNPFFPSENRCGEETEEMNQSSHCAIDRTSHDIANQLSIIYLCCCELRCSLAEKLLPNQLDELGRIETATQESARLIEKLKTTLHDQERASKNPASILTRVQATDSLYPIASNSALRR